MLLMVARRLGIGLLLLVLVSLLVFLATQLLPGDAAESLLGRYATPAAVAALREHMHLDEPAASQYVKWLGGLFTGHWGESIVSGDSISAFVGDRVRNTGVLVVLVTVIATPIALAVGVVSAMRSEGWLDHALSIVTLIMVAVPVFVVGIGLIWFFGTNVLHVFPPASVVDPGEPVWTQPKVLVLPTLTLILGVISYPIRMVRASMVETLQSDFVMMARLKGLSERTVIVRHALRNAIGPTIQATALNLLFLAGGVVTIETVFGYPGIGTALVDAVNQRDVPVVQTLTVLLAAFYIVVNIVADLLVVLVTPRLRTQFANRSGARL
jgi:peptide/nickel transport system permease protein